MTTEPGEAFRAEEEDVEDRLSGGEIESDPFRGTLGVEVSTRLIGSRGEKIPVGWVTIKGEPLRS